MIFLSTMRLFQIFVGIKSLKIKIKSNDEKADSALMC